MDLSSEFFAAVESGDQQRVSAILQAAPELVRARDPEGATALHLAAFHAHKELVDLLCRAGADVNARDARFGATPAGWALHYLRERGAFLAIEIDDVAYAIQSRDAAWARRLVERHPRIASANGADGRPLAESARECGAPEIARIFNRAP